MQVIHGLPDVNGVMQLLADAAAAVDPAAADAALTEVFAMYMYPKIIIYLNL